MTDREVMQQALDALDQLTDDVDGTGLNTKPSFDAALLAITDLRTALEQQQAEPVVWGVDWGHNGDRSCVAIIKKHHNGTMEVIATEYDTKASAPPQRQWVGLEAEDLAQIESDEFWQTGNHMAIAVAVEAKLKERNT